MNELQLLSKIMELRNTVLDIQNSEEKRLNQCDISELKAAYNLLEDIPSVILTLGNKIKLNVDKRLETQGNAITNEIKKQC